MQQNSYLRVVPTASQERRGCGLLALDHTCPLLGVVDFLGILLRDRGCLLVSNLAVCGCAAPRQLVVVAINFVVAIVIIRLLYSKFRSCGALSRVKIMEVVLASNTLCFGLSGSGFRGCRPTPSHNV